MAAGSGAFAGYKLFMLAALHPLEYIAFNTVAGGVQGAYGRFDMDYWTLAAPVALRRLEDRLDLEVPNPFSDKRAEPRNSPSTRSSDLIVHLRGPMRARRRKYPGLRLRDIRDSSIRSSCGVTTLLTGSACRRSRQWWLPRHSSTADRPA